MCEDFSCCGCDDETWFKIKLYATVALVWVGIFVLGCVYIVYAPLALYDERAKHWWKDDPCRVDGYYITKDDPNRRRLSEATTFYAVVQVTMNPDDNDSYAALAEKFPSWATGTGGDTLHGWDSKKDAKRWAKSFDVNGVYTCWRQPGNKGTVALANPGYHYYWQVAIGAAALSVTGAPILGLFLLFVVMYFVLVVKPQRAHRAEARRLAKRRAEGDARLETGQPSAEMTAMV
mmetsp:Transcript_13654/g.43117  ORF Transcript_13654/g.43117 Transcript_13654/m.43117 type:complete len:233 (+) Transcript_13654:68-766(+)